MNQVTSFEQIRLAPRVNQALWDYIKHVMLVVQQVCATQGTTPPSLDKQVLIKDDGTLLITLTVKSIEFSMDVPSQDWSPRADR